MSSRPMLPGDWPFSVRRLPFFYGWVIWLMSTIGFLMSIPGQTIGMAVFTDPFLDVLGLSRTELSVAYFLGTVTSALFLTRAGRWYDRFGARMMTVCAAVGLALMLLFISTLDRLGQIMSTATGLTLGVVTFPLIMLGYFGVRFAGQGVLTSASRNVLLAWFERRRGLVSGVRGVFVSFGFSLAPLMLALLIASFGWRGALWVMAAVLGGGFAIAALLMLRDSPGECGLEPDGTLTGPAEDEHTGASRTPVAATLAEARRSPVFWIYSLGMSLWALFGTAVTYHIVSIFADAGRSASEAYGYFFPNAVVATTVNLIASSLADRTSLKPYLVAMIGAFLIGTIGLMNLQAQWGFWVMVVGFGTGGGLWGTLSNLAFVRYFGLLHLGEISGLNTAVTVFASAVGPLLFAVGKDLAGTYQGPAWVCVCGLVALLVAALIIRQPEP